MGRGGRNGSTEEDRMKSMEKGPTMKEGQTGSGPKNFEKQGFHGGAKKNPRGAARPRE